MHAVNARLGHVFKETRNAPAERCDPRGPWRVRAGRQLGRRYDRGEPANTRGVLPLLILAQKISGVPFGVDFLEETNNYQRGLRNAVADRRLVDPNLVRETKRHGFLTNRWENAM